MNVEDCGSGSCASSSENVLSVINRTDFFEEGLEFDERFDEEMKSAGEGSVKLGSGVGDANVNHSVGLGPETDELGESTGQGRTWGYGGTEAANVEAEGVENANDGVFGVSLPTCFKRGRQ
jgi:hypothetical protein